ncbi:hypothetical protein [uncultured Maribacter sp.]|uniref:hypothetical protein n=1 Tax=uncultured Maribacter sp. TaxID=431308 RepID=UPI00262E2582|nr:hypothetical protein [uncultured Maribacter sp.]
MNEANTVNSKAEIAPKIGTVVLVLGEQNPEYSKEQVLELSRAIDPMVDTFDGYYGRKMIFGIENPKLMGDAVYYRDIESFEKATEIELKSETCLKFFATMLPESNLTKMLIGSPVYISPKKQEKVGVVEVALFKAKPEFTKEEITKSAIAINPILKKLDGFISRKLAVTTDGQWMDILYWSSLEKAKSALAVVMKSEVCKTFFEMTDEANSEFIHFDIAIDTEQ